VGRDEIERLLRGTFAEWERRWGGRWATFGVGPICGPACSGMPDPQLLFANHRARLYGADAITIYTLSDTPEWSLSTHRLRRLRAWSGSIRGGRVVRGHNHEQRDQRILRMRLCHLKRLRDQNSSALPGGQQKCLETCTFGNGLWEGVFDGFKIKSAAVEPKSTPL
jgi:hypothetical protein